MSKSIDLFFPQIRPYAPGLLVPVAQNHIRSALQKFCKRSRIWRYSEDISMDAVEKAVTVPAQSILYEIESASMDNQPLYPMSVVELDEMYPIWRTDTTEGGPRYISQTQPNNVRIFPYSTGTLTLNGYLMPTDECTEVPDWFVDNYRRVIADGALSELLILPKQNYTDPSLAQFFLNRFNDEVDRLSNLNIRGQQRAYVRSKAQFF